MTRAPTGDHRIAVVESDALTEDELAGETILRHRPRLGQARRGETAWHGFDQSVVEGVEHHERRDHPFRFPGIEPPGRERDVHPPGHGAFGRGVERTGPREEEEREREHRLHGSLPRLAAFEAPVNDRRGNRAFLGRESGDVTGKGYGVWGPPTAYFIDREGRVGVVHF